MKQSLSKGSARHTATWCTCLPNFAAATGDAGDCRCWFVVALMRLKDNSAPVLHVTRPIASRRSGCFAIFCAWRAS